MKTLEYAEKGLQHRDAADWFVALDSGTADQSTDDEFVSWLDRDPDHAASFERCEAASIVTNHLRDDPDLAWAFSEASALASADMALDRERHRTPWFARPRFGIALAALAVVAFATYIATFGGHGSKDSPALVPNPMGDTPVRKAAPIKESVTLPVDESATQPPPQPQPEPQAQQQNDQAITKYRTLEDLLHAVQSDLNKDDATYEQRLEEFKKASQEDTGESDAGSVNTEPPAQHPEDPRSKRVF